MTRPTSTDQTRPYMANLAHALNTIGVAPGEDFIIVHPRELEVSPDANKLGAFAKGSDSSRSAALANYPRSGCQRREILEFVAARHNVGATREEITEGTGFSPDAVRPRVKELLDYGWLVVSPKTRATKYDNEAEVLVRSERGPDDPPDADVVTKALGESVEQSLFEERNGNPPPAPEV